jgi:hypothetical protein
VVDKAKDRADANTPHRVDPERTSGGRKRNKRYFWPYAQF